MCGRAGAKEAFLLQGVWALCALKVPALPRQLSGLTLIEVQSLCEVPLLREPAKLIFIA
jgi:hypothetical protein